MALHREYLIVSPDTDKSNQYFSFVLISTTSGTQYWKTGQAGRVKTC